MKSNSSRVLPYYTRNAERYRPTREQIEDQVAHFLQRGGVIQQLRPQPDLSMSLSQIGSQMDLGSHGMSEEERRQLSSTNDWERSTPAVEERRY